MPTPERLAQQFEAHRAHLRAVASRMLGSVSEAEDAVQETGIRLSRTDGNDVERARNLFFQSRDKDLSFTDCTSFAVMRELRLTTVITTDGHFRQVGFDVLPAARPQRTRKLRRS